ncbi:TIGR02647 family protein [Marinobacter sp. CHS3-4]|uniref:TIGR02647 family protein n=1 Tax=Marinobacter sp. CHS3-4 TaxID=3045174 RepID=UPI0024B485BF|nr:TIGR02647 family protein [Marinobacter sp. CHS3-4]MDI9246563.1 TIGR02647 family protein [Marinobacter sp. CHS3-4]
MAFTTDHLAELNLLSMFNLSSINEGIKVHSHSASAEAIAAAERLYAKGLITQKDGGYLTSLGSETAEHAQRLLSVLSSTNNTVT